MALDGFMYDNKKNEIDYFPIDDSLHQVIFENASKLYMRYPQLCKLRDYYKDAEFKGDEVYHLAEELKRCKEFIRKDKHKNIDILIRKLQNINVAKVEFYAD